MLELQNLHFNEVDSKALSYYNDIFFSLKE